MRRHDLELITALAEGALEDETEARALIDASPSLRAEYEAQVRALAALRATHSAQLTDSQRAALRRDVWTEMRSPNVPASAPAPWYARWSTAAAALVLVVGGGVVLNQQSDLQEASADSTSSLSGSALGEAGDGESDGGADSSRDELALEDAAAAPTAEVDADSYRDFANEIRMSSYERSAYQASSDFLAEGNSLSECLADAGLENHVVVGEITPPSGSLAFAVSPTDQPDPETPISFIDSTTCTVVFIAN